MGAPSLRVFCARVGYHRNLNCGKFASIFTPQSPSPRRQNRQLANLFPLHGTRKVRGMFHHPHFGNDLANQLSVTEKPHHRTLGNHNSNRIGQCAHIRCGNVTAAESERHVHLCKCGVRKPWRTRSTRPITFAGSSNLSACADRTRSGSSTCSGPPAFRKPR